MKNKRVKVEMARAGINQARLAELLNISTPELSIMLNKYELAVKEQNEIIARIREHEALKCQQA